MENFLPVITAGGGVLVGAVALLPLLIGLAKQFKKARTVTKKFISKYSARFYDPQFRRDFDEILKCYDDILETIADVLERFGLRRLPRELRDLIK